MIKFKTSPNPIWYLLPILFSLLGGYVGWYIFRNSNLIFAERLRFFGWAAGGWYLLTGLTQSPLGSMLVVILFSSSWLKDKEKKNKNV